LCQNQRSTFTVVHLDGSEEKRQVDVYVTGTCAVAVTPTFVPIDNAPPSISDMAAKPALISVQSQCGATPPTTLINARVSDARGLARVVSRVSRVGEGWDNCLSGYHLCDTLDAYYKLTVDDQSWSLGS